MATFLADTNVWLRSVGLSSPQYSAASAALRAIVGAAELFITPQNLVEFWVVATRPAENNGLGWTTERAGTRLKQIRESFLLLAEGPTLFETWFQLVREHQVRGKRAHDVRIAATVLAHGVDY